MNAHIFDIYRGTTHDGPGMRTTIFFKGCTLRCAWCHNPEGIGFEREIWWEARKCIGCGSCVEACSAGACAFDASGLKIQSDLCVQCGACVRACPGCALKWTSREESIEKLVDTVCRDKPYFLQWGGGATASGGEALAQADCVKTLFEALKKEGVETALDTCGFAPWDAFEKVLPVADYVLYDIKILDSMKHREWTGQGNERILSNLNRLAGRMRDASWPGRLWIRTPLIPGATDADENIRAIGNWLRDNLDGLVDRWELCAFNNACISKYEKLRQPWPFEHAPLISRARADELKAVALETGFDPSRFIITGILSD